MFLKLMYITNHPVIAGIAQEYGVDRIWIDLETLGKDERQKNMNTVKSHHSISDIGKIKMVLNKAELLVRVNPWNINSEKEINEVIDAGADIIMLPMWRSISEVNSFLNVVNGRIKTTLLLETKEAVDCIDQILSNGGFDEIHIGLNDLHISYGMKFMFQLLSNGVVESLCEKFKAYKIPYGFGGIAKIGGGILPAEKIIMEHYRLGSTRAILSRSFCNWEIMKNVEEIKNTFKVNMEELEMYSDSLVNLEENEFLRNCDDIKNIVNKIVRGIA